MKGFKKIIVMAILAVMVALCSFGVMTTAFAEDYEVSTTQVAVGANEIETEVGKKERLTFIANGYCNVAGFQFQIVLPTNVTFSAFEIGENYEDANYQYSVNGEEIHVICNSDVETYASQTELFYVDVIAREVGYGDAWSRSCMMTDVNANDIYCMAYSVGITVFGEGQGPAIKGDVNGDQDVNLVDLMLMQRYVIGSLGDEAYFSTNAGDVDGNDDINLIDCQQVQRYLVGKITFDELQNLSNGSGGNDDGNGGSGTVPIPPEMPNDKYVYDVHVGAQLLKEALVIDYYNWNATFTYEGQTLVGTPCPLSLIDESANDGVVVFATYHSTEVFVFVLGGEKEVKLDEHYDLAEAVQDKPTNFDDEYYGDYQIISNGEQIGSAYINVEGVFTGYVNILVDGIYFSPNINGVINTDDNGTTYAYVFGDIQKEIKIDYANRQIIPLENGQELGKQTTFIINYNLGDGHYIVEEVVYTMKEGEDLKAVAKMLAHQHLQSGFKIRDYSIIEMQENRYSIEVDIEYTGENGDGETTEGKPIMLYRLVANAKHEMLKPMTTINVSSEEQLSTMIKGFTQVPAETGMTYVGLYTDRACKAPYTESMGINVNELYVVCTYADDVNMVKGLGGTFSLLEQDDDGNRTALEGSLKIDEDKQTFELTIGDTNGKKYSGQVIVVGAGEYDKNGKPSYAQLALITANNVQISGSINSKEGVSTFTIESVEDYSSYTTKEEFKATAGVYTTYITYGGIDMGKCDITLKDNGVFTLEMFFIKQIGSYVFNVNLTGKTTITMAVQTVQDDPMEAVIDFEKKEIHIVVVDDGPSVDVGGGESTREYVANIVIVANGEYHEGPVYLKEDSYDALKEQLYKMFGDDLENITIYLDEAQTIELSSDTFDTVNRTFFIVVDLSNVQGDYDNGYSGTKGEKQQTIKTIG